MIFRITTIIATGFLVVKANVILSPSPALAAEGESFTWTCTYSGSETVLGFTWLLNGNTLAVFISPACTPHSNPGPPDSSLYEYACLSTSQATFTVKKISNINNGDRWQCNVAAPRYIYSNNATVTVQVSVNSVSLTPTTGSIRENVETTFTCETSTSRPAANITWYKESLTGQKLVITSKVSSTTESIADLEKSKSVLKYTPLKSDNTYKIYCQALNIPGRTPVMSTKFQMDVQFSPESAPYIQNYSNGNAYKVLENKQGIMSCIIKGGNPLATLTWTCFNNGLSTETSGTTVTKTVTWSATRGTDRSCTCQSSHPIAGTQSVSVSVKILYPPTTPVFSIKNTEVAGTVKVIKNNQVSITCKSTGQPNPIQYTWKHNSTSTSGATLTTSSIWNGDNYTCEVENLMNPSYGSDVPGKNLSSLSFEVLYPPTTPAFRYWNTTGATIPNNLLNVIQNDQVKVACLSDSKPDPDFYQWDTRGNSQILTVPSITADKQHHMYKCEVRNTMTETVPTTSNPTRGTSTSTLTVHVMYPPTNPTFKYRYGQGSQKSFSNSLSVEEFNPTAFTVTCESDSRPEPVIIWENITQPSPILTLKNLERSKAGNYNCKAENIMNRTFGNPKKVVSGRNFQSFELNILYPPEVVFLNNRSIAEGKPFDLNCSVKVGNPKETTFKWRKSDGTVSSNQVLTIRNVSRTNAGFYTCAAVNSMKQTGQTATKGEDSKSFYLNVWYMASITSFVVRGSQSSSVTVDEKADVTFTCIVESNPGSSIAIQLPNKMFQRKENATALSYNHQGATCLDTGVYTCSASNPHNNGKASEKKLSLFVRCYPRSLTQVKENVTSALRVQSSFIFKGLAYPIPTFTWFRKQETTWKELSNNTRVSISITGVNTNLTITNVSQSDYGEYQLKIENEIDMFIQHYALIPEGVPETPSELRVIEEHVSDTSVLLQWKPGFDGGPEQIFVLMYKKTSDQKWMNRTVKDTKNNVMNYTLDNLASASEYQVVIFSQNRVGDSVGRKNITFLTNEGSPDCETNTRLNDSTSVIIVGCVLGIVILILAIYAGYITLLLKRTKGVKEQNEKHVNSLAGRGVPVYANLAYSATESHEPECTGMSNSVFPSSNVDNNEYMALDDKFMENKETYDVINVKR